MTALGLIVVDVVDMFASIVGVVGVLNERQRKCSMKISRLDIHHDIHIPSADPSARQRSGFVPMYSKTLIPGVSAQVETLRIGHGGMNTELP